MKKLFIVISMFILLVGIALAATLIDPNRQVDWSKTINQSSYWNATVTFYDDIIFLGNPYSYINGDIIPIINDTYTLGNENYTFSEAHVNNMYVYNDVIVNTGNKICLDGVTCSHYVYFNGTETVIE